MPFQRATLTTIRQRAAAQVAAELNVGSVLPKGVLAALSNALAGMSHSLHGHLDWLSHQFIPTEETDSAELERIGRLWGKTRKPAAGATGLVHCTGSGVATIPAGTIFKRADGAEYETLASTDLVSDEADVEVEALVQDGVNGVATNATVGTTLSLSSPIAGVSSQAEVADQGGGLGLVNGSDLETDLQLLSRILQRVQTPPHGSAEADFIGWALEVSGVTRAWVITPWGLLGTIGVAFVRDGDAGSIFPNGAAVDDMQAYLEDPARKPVTASIVAFAPSEETLDADITLTPNNAAVRAEVDAAIDDLLLREASVGGTLKLSKLRQAIGNAPGVEDFVVNDPIADRTSAADGLLVRGNTVFS